jgi:uncharacterized protein YkwD
LSGSPEGVSRPTVCTYRVAVRLLLISVTIATAALTLAAPAASAHRSACPFARTPVGAARPAQLRRSVVCLINRERRAHGLPGLRANRRLDRSAQGWTNAMVRQGIFTHGADFAARITAVGFDWSRAGENIATGFTTPASVVSAWMASTGHCQNILSPMFREVGTGVTRGKIAGYSTLPGTWAQDFGLGMNQQPLSSNFGPAAGCPY